MFGRKTKITISYLTSIMIALFPAVQIFKFPFIGCSITSILIPLTTVICLFFIMSRPVKVKGLPIFLLWLLIFVKSNGSTVTMIMWTMIFVILFSTANNLICLDVFNCTVEAITIINSYTIVIQTLFYYLFHIRLKVLSPVFLIEDTMRWITAENGVLYRPSGFFIEPSHFAQYSCLALISLLFYRKKNYKNKRNVILIIFASVCTTSGMGIVLCALIIGWYIFNKEQGFRKTLKSIIKYFPLIFLAVLLLYQINFVKLAIQRIYKPIDSNSGIGLGRYLYWKTYISTMTPRELFVGKGILEMPNVFMTGIMEMIYCCGIITLVVLIFVVVYFCVIGKNLYTLTVGIVFMGVFVIANLFTFIAFSFWLSLLISSSISEANKIESKKKWFNEKICNV